MSKGNARSKCISVNAGTRILARESPTRREHEEYQSKSSKTDDNARRDKRVPRFFGVPRARARRHRRVRRSENNFVMLVTIDRAD